MRNCETDSHLDHQHLENESRMVFGVVHNAAVRNGSVDRDVGEGILHFWTEMNIGR
eukprot:CAMPEP_0184689856 /NCGR_PEP_ID=MMETSP0312-20130426/30889_1 /TAXON_ID=31354 /ORGANISM="Compsopogon coeruleus, Strain SAG 36.94" /LENGTH=55 /DNA_ID=CAMNT_0027147259 /DNA_START=636 /DNA_END=803 /DNA_ORIENTATION=+